MSDRSMLVLGFSEYRHAGQRLAEALAVPYQEAEVHVFPDGEHKITLPPELPDEVVICRSLFEPNDKLIDLQLISGTARELGAQRLIMVAPYLCYMRQDKAFHPGEVVSQRIIGKFLAGLCDALITVDPHMHRTPRLADAVPVRHAVNLSAAVPMAGYLKGMADNPLLVGPDEESRQWVRAIAELTGLEYTVAEKTRSGDREISIRLPEASIANRDVVLVDDIVSTGCTLAQASEHLINLGAHTVRCMATHVLPHGGAPTELANAGVTELLSTDSIPHPTNRIWLAELIADSIRQLDWSNG